MPGLVASKFPKPKSEDEFEDLATDVLSRFWRAYVTRHGRRGQKQDGVDAYGEPPHLGGGTAGAQYKNVKSLTIEEVRSETVAADAFVPALSEYLMVTSLDADADLQEEVGRPLTGCFPNVDEDHGAVLAAARQEFALLSQSVFSKMPRMTFGRIAAPVNDEVCPVLDFAQRA